MLEIAIAATVIFAAILLSKAGHPSAAPRTIYQPLTDMLKVGRPFVVVMGDSVTEAANLPASVCGLPLVNAGISGSRASALVPLAEEMTAHHIAPAFIVLAIGVNDALAAYHTDFRRAYDLLIDSLPKSTIALATLAPVNGSLPIGATVDQSAAQKIDAIIRATAASRGMQLIDLDHLRMGTRDGVHPGEQDYPVWLRAVIGGVETGLCPGK